jgi:tRNA(fMet)-specific endonuclease VapC
LRYLLDTNVVSELISRRPDERVVRWIDDLDPNSVYLGAITIGEIRKGIEKLPDSGRRDNIHRWLSEDLLLRFGGRILNLDVDVALTWGELTGRLEKQGKTMPAIDSLIAALALNHQLTLATHNEDDFQNARVQIFNPWN